MRNYFFLAQPRHNCRALYAYQFAGIYNVLKLSIKSALSNHYAFSLKILSPIQEVGSQYPSVPFPFFKASLTSDTEVV